jgi:SSS family solute:Na+ symporter
VLPGIAATVLFSAYAVLVALGVWPRVINAYYTSIFANVIMFATCCVAALFAPRRGGSLVNLTVWDRAPESDAAPAACSVSIR